MKLVRDRIPEIVAAKGETEPFRQVADDAEHDHLLDAKLDEELGEYREDGDLAELADLLSVIRAIALRRGCPWDALVAAAEAKELAYGGFLGGVVWLGEQNRPYDREAAS